MRLDFLGGLQAERLVVKPVNALKGQLTAIEFEEGLKHVQDELEGVCWREDFALRNELVMFYELYVHRVVNEAEEDICLRDNQPYDLFRAWG